MDKLVAVSLLLSFVGLLLLIIAAEVAQEQPLLRLPEETESFTATVTAVDMKENIAFLQLRKQEDIAVVYFPWPNESIAEGSRVKVVARASQFRGREQLVAEEIRLLEEERDS